MAEVDPSEYDTEQEENVLLEELYPRVLLTETKTTSDEKDDVDLDLDLLNDDTGVNAARTMKILLRKRSGAKKTQQKKHRRPRV